MNIKKAMVRYFLAVILPLVSIDLALATIYKTVDKDGNVIFTDSRPEGQPSEEVQLRPLTPIPAVPERKPVSSRPEKKEHKEPKGTYTRLQIVEPANDAAVRNQGNFTVKIVTEPGILPGHKIRLRLDDELAGESRRDLTFQLRNVDRGSHNLTVEIIDNQNKVIQSSDSTVHVHRTVYTPAAPVNPPAS